MKKLLLKSLFSLVLSILVSSNLFSQIDDEKKLGIKALDLNTISRVPPGKVDCKCDKNILKDGGFENLTNAPGSSNISPSSTPWKPNTRSPQWTPMAGACDQGFVSMWGNQTVGESIIQTGLTITAGKQYKIKFTARFANPTNISTYVQLKIFGFNGATAPYNSTTNVIGTSVNISSLGWVTYYIPCWTAPTNLTGIQLHPENQYTQNDGNYVSWIQIDNICMEECCDCPMPNTNVTFSLCTTLGGGTVANVSSIGASQGLGNGWTLKQVTCPGPNPCKWVAGGIKWQSVGSSIVIPASVLTPGCYVLTHYVNRCSRQWDPKACLSYKAICFTICDNSITVSPEQNPKSLMKVQSGEETKDEVELEAEKIGGIRN